MSETRASDLTNERTHQSRRSHGGSAAMATATPKWRRRGLLYEDTAETAWRSCCLGLTGCGSGTSVDISIARGGRSTVNKKCSELGGKYGGAESHVNG